MREREVSSPRKLLTSSTGIGRYLSFVSPSRPSGGFPPREKKALGGQGHWSHLGLDTVVQGQHRCRLSALSEMATPVPFPRA